MSSASLHKETCPKCGKEQMIERYDSINDYHKELFPKIADRSIFDYECEACKERIHSPYPLLFHKMGIRDIQIGYKTSPIRLPFLMTSPIMTAMKQVMRETGKDCEDITENYDNEEEFARRVSEFIS